MYRIGVGGFIHETHTFCPAPTDVKDFEDQKGVHSGQDLIDYFTGTNDYYAGYFDVLGSYGAEVIPTSHAYAGVNNYVTKAAFDKYTSAIVDGLKAAGKLDGALLALHGAMVSEEHVKAEAEIVRRVRKAMGDIPIFVTLDFHANEDHELTDVADAVFIQKKYPHTDMR
ncbi:MAG: M81 family metallopeptidase, partial [Bacillota bacterium]|nr:M81 family metallopeptidase [Bacillota bacterium]